MFGRAKTLKGAFLGLALLLVGNASAKAADNLYGMVSLDNNSGNYVTYQFRWGENAAWQTYVLAPGQSRWHSWQYAYVNQNSSPRPYVRFAQDTQGFLGSKEYYLEVNAAPFQHKAYARQYAFRLSLFGDYIDLHTK